MSNFKRSFYFFFAATALMLGFTGCGDDNTDTTPTETDTTVYPIPDDAFGALTAIKTFTTVEVGGFTTDIVFGTGVAVFINGSSFLPAGTVTANSETLTKNDNNSYVFIPDFGSASAATGINFGNTASWDVSGEGSVPAFMKSYSGFPSVPEITSAKTVNVSSGYTMTWNGISSADSLIVSVFGSNNAAMKTVAGNTTSVTFSSDDLSDVGTTDFGIIQVAAYRQTSEEFGGKKMYFTNESVGSESGVTIQ